MRTRLLVATALAAALPLAACGGEADEAATRPDRQPATAAPAAAAEPTGAVIEVRMVTDDRGNHFEPEQVQARRGDVLRFVLASGVHNVSFPADSNGGAAGLPAPGPYLQLPGQTYDVPVELAPGSYFFQCDPHALLGMTGRLTVVE
ncbi:MAG TPA: plastocyanin/azurin family copper-binding protein [Longimicrobiales bacterium]